MHLSFRHEPVTLVSANPRTKLVTHVTWLISLGSKLINHVDLHRALAKHAKTVQRYLASVVSDTG